MYKFGVINALSGSIWGIVCNNIINNTYTGDTLTKFNANYKTVGLVSGFVGGAILLCLPFQIPVHICILMQCAAMIITGVLDYTMYTIYEKRKTVIDNVPD